MDGRLFAKVIVDVPLMHLDRTFDYEVPVGQQVEIAVGARVRVRFAGRKVLGYVVALSETTEIPEKVQPLLEVLGPAVITEEQFGLSAEVARRWLGTTSEVLKTAVPARHAKTESAVFSLLPDAPAVIDQPTTESIDAWSSFVNGSDWLNALQAEERPRGSLITTSMQEPLAMALSAVQTAAGSSIVVVPDGKDLDRLELLAKTHLPKGSWVRLSSDLGPATRYRNYLRVLRNEVNIVFGTRTAVFAPVSNLKLIVVVEEGDDSLSEQQAPTWHAREVSALVATRANCAWLSVGSSRSVEVQSWVQKGWANSLTVIRELRRELEPAVRATSDLDLARDPRARSARLPAAAFAALRDGLQRGPVLISVPRRGYHLNLVCNTCRQAARCPSCAGPLQRSSVEAIPTCAWCGHVASPYKCRWCGPSVLQARNLGAVRTAEELGRAFPDIPVIRSGRDLVVGAIDDKPMLVIATPGAEPRVTGGQYAAAVILDADSTLLRTDLRAEEEAHRRWRAVSALVSPLTGRVAIAGDDSQPVIQALLRHDPEGYAVRVLQERVEASLPPESTLVEIWCEPNWFESNRPQLPEAAVVLGPVVGRRGTVTAERVIITVTRSKAGPVLDGLRAWLGRHSAAKSAPLLIVHVDPPFVA